MSAAQYAQQQLQQQSQQQFTLQQYAHLGLQLAGSHEDYDADQLKRLEAVQKDHRECDIAKGLSACWSEEGNVESAIKRSRPPPDHSRTSNSSSVAWSWNVCGVATEVWSSRWHT